MDHMQRPLSEVLREADDYFIGRSPIHAAVVHIAKALSDANIPFAVAGCLAVNAHGHVRMTEHVDVLLTRDGLARFKELRLGRGWIEQFEGSKGLRDAVNKVKIDVLLTGEYPGDGLPKPVAFPDPADVGDVRKGIPYISLPTLLTLKIASGMTARHRPRDFDDVIQLVRKNNLGREFAGQLHPYVREKYLELWPLAQVQEDY
jgi:hypothetical protein